MIWVAKNLYFFNCLLDGAHTTIIQTQRLRQFLYIATSSGTAKRLPRPYVTVIIQPILS